MSLVLFQESDNSRRSVNTHRILLIPQIQKMKLKKLMRFIVINDDDGWNILLQASVFTWLLLMHFLMRIDRCFMCGMENTQMYYWLSRRERKRRRMLKNLSIIIAMSADKAYWYTGSIWCHVFFLPNKSNYSFCLISCINILFVDSFCSHLECISYKLQY